MKVNEKLSKKRKQKKLIFTYKVYFHILLIKIENENCGWLKID